MIVFFRAVDILFACLTLLCLLPVLLIISAAIRLGSRGPIFTGREVLANDGSRFRLYRFRTARADGAEINTARRVLRRLHIDLLPVLWNVVRGDVSMIDLVLARRM